MTVTVKSYLTLALTLMTLKETVPTGYSRHNIIIQLDIKAVQIIVLVIPVEGRGRYLDPRLIPPRDRDIDLVK
jgi:general stress protein CsbA